MYAVNADCLSRAPLSTSENVSNFIDGEVHAICNATVLQISSPKLNFRKIQEEAKTNLQLSKFLTELQSSNIADTEYTIDSGVVFRGQGVVISNSLQKTVLEELHYMHIGITKMKHLVRKCVYWLSVDKYIETFVRPCPAREKLATYTY